MPPEDAQGQLENLIARGDAFAGVGDDRAATSFYAAALRLARSLPSLPPSLHAPLRTAQARCRDYAARYERFLADHLAAAGASPAEGSRFAHALDLLSGRRQIYPQQPNVLYFPELPARQFYDRADFAWCEGLEAETDAIREEARAALARSDAFEPYLRAASDRPHDEHHAMAGNADWGAFYLWWDGTLIEENAALCPRTVAALTQVPLTKVPGRLPTVLFSLLKAGARIPPHTGFVNTRLICHLPLVVPEGCGLRVGNETRAWREGEVTIFDDTIEHEAWNHSGSDRLVLLFDVWQPALSAQERHQVSTLLSAIDAYGRP